MTGFDESKHPRAEHGRFAGAGAPVPAASTHWTERRSLATAPSYNRMGARTQGIPEAYTGSKVVSLPIGSFTRAELALHRPKTIKKADHQELVAKLATAIEQQREGTVARGLEPIRRGAMRGQSLIPEGTSKRLVHRAYNHAAMIALHKFGVGHYDFAMDDALKEEMAPLVPFMRYAERRVRSTMLTEQRGAWRPYRAAFGIPFPDKRRDEAGNVRLRVKPLDVFVKAVPIGALAKVR